MKMRSSPCVRLRSDARTSHTTSAIAGRADTSEDETRRDEDAGADHGADDDRDSRGTAEITSKLGLGSERFERFHRELPAEDVVAIASIRRIP